MTRDRIDIWFIRAKDIIIIIAAILSFAGYGLKIYRLPGIQDAQAQVIETHGKKLIEHDKDIAVINSGINDIKRLILSGRQQIS